MDMTLRSLAWLNSLGVRSREFWPRICFPGSSLREQLEEIDALCDPDHWEAARDATEDSNSRSRCARLDGWSDSQGNTILCNLHLFYIFNEVLLDTYLIKSVQICRHAPCQ